MGEFQVTIGGRAIPSTAWERRAADLVKLLALSRGARAARDVVIEALCPQLSPEAGAAAIHKAASQARSALGDPDALVVRGGEIALVIERTIPGAGTPS